MALREASIALDVSTLVVVTTCVTGFLGLFLLTTWTHDRTRAMLWWAMAYLVGGLSVALWLIDVIPAALAALPSAFVFFACGMMWNAARLFHGRGVLWGGLCAGAFAWLFANAWPAFDASAAARVALSSLIIATYTFLTAAELWRERRKTRLGRWGAVFIPVLHGAVFLFPLPLAGLLPQDAGRVALSAGWMGLFALETLLYVVGTAFIVLVLSKERMVRMHKTAASTDPLTGLFNRRAFFEAAEQMIARQKKKDAPVSVLAFDLDHFKSINDRFGHALGDEALRVFAATASTNMRAADVVARIGGEEFVALIPGDIAAAAVAAERVRLAFAEVGRIIGGQAVGATVSIGAASGPRGMDVHALMGWADYALYSAKANGRNRVETAVADILDRIAPCPAKAASPAPAERAPRPALHVVPVVMQTA
jgi:diguanylate cyclase (GGDEF)-like protein